MFSKAGTIGGGSFGIPFVLRCNFCTFRYSNRVPPDMREEAAFNRPVLIPAPAREIPSMSARNVGLVCSLPRSLPRAAGFLLIKR
jgi:hypothetical protein